MSSFVLELARAVDVDLAREVAKQAVFASVAVRAFEWDDTLRRARVDVETGADEADVDAKVRRLVTGMLARHRPVPKRVLHTSARRDRGPMVPDVERQLGERGFLRELGPGQMALSGPPLAFARALDARLSTLARERFGAREDAYPALIPTAILHRCGYLTSFPNAASMVTHLVEDVDAIERFREANRGAPTLTIPDPTALSHAAACLAPAVCYHLYPTLEGAQLARPLVVTAMGRCFRYESRNMRGLERLWDFEMREVIFCGAEPTVRALREDLISLAAIEAGELDLDLSIESATDPFFSSEYAQKTYWQAKSDLKLELLLALPPDDRGRPRATAAASFNLHDDHFGRTFAITTDDGAPAFSGCAAWGLARWVLAGFAQHGLDPERWPAAWRSEVFA